MRKIIQGIRLKQESYGPGREADLAAVATPEQLKDWKKRGLIEGTWKGADDEEGGDKLDQFAASLEQFEADFTNRLEPIAAQISASLSVERNSDETPLQFLERFADQCEEITSRLGEQYATLKSDTDAANSNAERFRLENETLHQVIRDAKAENDKLKGELNALQADAGKADGGKADAPKADAPTDAKKPAAKADAGKAQS